MQVRSSSSRLELKREILSPFRVRKYVGLDSSGRKKEEEKEEEEESEAQLTIQVQQRQRLLNTHTHFRQIDRCEERLALTQCKTTHYYNLEKTKIYQ